MTKGRAAVVGAVSIGILGTLAACSAVLGITDYTGPSGGGGEGGSSSSGGSSGGADGGGLDASADAPKDGTGVTLNCDTEDGAAGALGCKCDPSKTPLGCNGCAQPDHLLCGTDGAAGPRRPTPCVSRQELRHAAKCGLQPHRGRLHERQLEPEDLRRPERRPVRP